MLGLQQLSESTVNNLCSHSPIVYPQHSSYTVCQPVRWHPAHIWPESPVPMQEHESSPLSSVSGDNQELQYHFDEDNGLLYKLPLLGYCQFIGQLHSLPWGPLDNIETKQMVGDGDDQSPPCWAQGTFQIILCCARNWYMYVCAVADDDSNKQAPTPLMQSQCCSSTLPPLYPLQSQQTPTLGYWATLWPTLQISQTDHKSMAKEHVNRASLCPPSTPHCHIPLLMLSHIIMMVVVTKPTSSNALVMQW